MKKATELIDFHAHILPGADHGSRDIETSLSQLSILKKAGVEAVCATPHFYPQKDSVASFLERREGCAKALFSSVGEECIPKILLGAEVLVCPGIDHMEDLSKLCIEGTDVILLEMPFSTFNDSLVETVAKISRMGLTVVMAHIDRYPMSDIMKLCSECDVLYQLNGETVSTMKGRKKADKIVSLLPVVAIGSDIHGADKRAVKNFLGLAKRFEKAGIDHYGETCALLENAKVL